ncbi:unnamed protein product, partial [Didymodactylos carnosus]
MYHETEEGDYELNQYSQGAIDEDESYLAALKLQEKFDNEQKRQNNQHR